MKQKGFVLVLVMIFLVIISLLGASMFSGFIKDQKVAANLREKERASEAAQAAIDAAEYWLEQPSTVYNGSWVTGTDPATGIDQCLETPLSPTSSTPVVCATALTSPATLAWVTNSTGFGLALNNAAGAVTSVSTNGGVDTYASNANVYVQYLGVTNANPPTAMYQVTATAAGGNATAVAVKQAVFEVQALSRDISGG